MNRTFIVENRLEFDTLVQILMDQGYYWYRKINDVIPDRLQEINNSDYPFLMHMEDGEKLYYCSSSFGTGKHCLKCVGEKQLIEKAVCFLREKKLGRLKDE